MEIDSDFCLAMGSSLTVYPAAGVCEGVGRRHMPLNPTTEKSGQDAAQPYD